MTPADRISRHVKTTSPLPARLRPRRLADVVGQDELIGPDGVLSRLLRSGELPSMVLWGPPGSGKTTIGRLLAAELDLRLATLDSTNEGIAALRAQAEAARTTNVDTGQRTLLFIDEIHRADRRLTDALLPLVEHGMVILVGATTEPPAATLSPALLSRLRVFRLRPLDETALRGIVERALADEIAGFGGRFTLDERAWRMLLGYSSADARRALVLLESAAALTASRLDQDWEEPGENQAVLLIEAADIRAAAAGQLVDYDRSGVISALIKSIRGNDPDAALYWLATATEAGEDPRYIARRLLISASEDIGNADPAALSLAAACHDVIVSVGAVSNDEGLYALAQTTAYLAATDKSPRSGEAFFAAREMVRASGPRAVPAHLRPSARTYRHPAREEGFDVEQDYLPEELTGQRFYEPADSGREVELARRLCAIRARRDRN